MTNASSSDTPPDLGVESNNEAPFIALSEVLLHPGMVILTRVFESVWIRAIDQAIRSNAPQSKPIMLVTATRRSSTDVVYPPYLYGIGVLARILAFRRLPDASMEVWLHGQQRVELTMLLTNRYPYPAVQFRVCKDESSEGSEVENVAQRLRTNFQQYVQLSSAFPNSVADMAARLKTPSEIADFVATQLRLPMQTLDGLNDMRNVRKRLDRLVNLLADHIRERLVLNEDQRQEIEAVNGTERLWRAVRILRQHYEHNPRAPLRTSTVTSSTTTTTKKKSSDDDDMREEDVARFRKRLEELTPPEQVATEIERQIERLKRLRPSASEYETIFTYLERALNVPWNTHTIDNDDLTHAREVLDNDHHGMEMAKERVLEYLAVRKLQIRHGATRLRSPILCFVGPPGVGKTSLGQAVAHVLGRNFARVALGGVHHESDIRGHRRTYIGSYPGRILQGVMRAGSSNPVLLLDEIDKVGGYSQSGDPSAALLEVMDPEQNNSYTDHYLDMPFDLSRTLFICTANTLGPIPRPLLDRMEIIELRGYNEDEKLYIARRFLMPLQRDINGLSSYDVGIPDDALMRIIREYTQEAGVRSLERHIGTVFRRMAVRIANEEDVLETIVPDDLDVLIGPPPLFLEPQDGRSSERSGL